MLAKAATPPFAGLGKRGCQNVDERIDALVHSPQRFDFLDGVENRGMVPAVIKSADLRQAPSAHALRKYMEI